jgi:hypothetical protein
MKFLNFLFDFFHHQCIIVFRSFDLRGLLVLIFYALSIIHRDILVFEIGLLRHEGIRNIIKVLNCVREASKIVHFDLFKVNFMLNILSNKYLHSKQRVSRAKKNIETLLTKKWWIWSNNWMKKVVTENRNGL